MICLAINNTKALKAQRSMVIEGDIVAVLLAAVVVVAAAPIALLVVVVDKWALQMPQCLEPTIPQALTPTPAPALAPGRA